MTCLNCAESVTVVPAFDIETGGGVGVVDEVGDDGRLVIKVFVKEKMWFDVSHSQVQLLNDILYHLGRLEEMNLLLCCTGCSECLHHVGVHLGGG